MIRFVLFILLTIGLYYTVLAIIDVIRTGKNKFLIPLLLLVPIIGAIIYFQSKEVDKNKSKFNF